MKKAIYPIVLFIVVILISCSTDPTINENKNIVMIEKFEQALRTVDSETLGSLLSDTYVGYGPSIKDSLGKDDFLLNWKYNMEYLYEKLEFKTTERIEVQRMKNGEEQQWVSSWGKLYIKYREHGNDAEIWSNTIYLIKDEKIEKIYIFYNEADALRQAGYHYIFKEPAKIED